VAVRVAMDIFPPYLSQEVLTDFMREGHFARHIRRMRLLYGERRTALVENIKEQFGEQFGSRLEIHGTQAGMHLAVTLPKGLNDREIANNAAREGLWLWPLSPSYLGAKRRQGFVLGFGNTPVEEMPHAVSQLRAQLAK
jgi:GntR family transcriptional regulator / MocR family aminotransferase